jgi:TonB-dependent SusC/RagA subfamily outer membrane receptor
MKITLPLIFILILGLDINAQSFVLQGTVKCFNKYPLSGVSITLKKAKQVFVTDSLGHFLMEVNRGEVLSFDANGFKPFKVRAEKPDSIQINLIFLARDKDINVAVGNGYVKKEDLVFAVSHLQQENNEYSNYSNIYDLLRGKFPGVDVVNSPEGTTVLIRGTHSLKLSSQPLFIVDGIPVSEISSVDPGNVKLIDVLRDASASFYGSRGSNGVIIIETKK